MENNISVMIRIDKNKVEKLKKVARQLSCTEDRDITYNDLIVSAAYEKYFKEDKSE